MDSETLWIQGGFTAEVESDFTFAASFLKAVAELDGLQDPSTVFCWNMKGSRRATKPWRTPMDANNRR